MTQEVNGVIVNQQLRECVEGLRGTFLARIQAAEKDAARYRWLRDKANGGGEGDPMVCLYPPDGTYLVDGDELDAAVDKAIRGDGK